MFFRVYQIGGNKKYFSPIAFFTSSGNPKTQNGQNHQVTGNK